MFTVTVFGSGKIGEAIACLLSHSGRYIVNLCDRNEIGAHRVASQFPHVSAHPLLLEDQDATYKLIEGSDAVISALPFYLNFKVAVLAHRAGVHYLDLTEDVKVTQQVNALAETGTSAFIPQCGLAPGFISVAAHHLVEGYTTVESLKMRVGALPLYPSNRLRYNLSWSTEGLINEYLNPCEIIENGKRNLVLPLEGLEHFTLDGSEYEAFNTSGGLGSLCETLSGKVQNLSYKSIRYPGHQELLSFLLDDLKFSEHREDLIGLFERSIPIATQDLCIIFVEARGERDGQYLQRTYASKIYHSTVNGTHLGAIQVTTAAGICAPLDLLLTGALGERKGVIKIEEIGLEQFLANEFGKFYQDKSALELPAA